MKTAFISYLTGSRNIETLWVLHPGPIPTLECRMDPSEVERVGYAASDLSYLCYL